MRLHLTRLSHSTLLFTTEAPMQYGKLDMPVRADIKTVDQEKAAGFSDDSQWGGGDLRVSDTTDFEGTA